MDPTEIRSIRKVFITERGAEVCRKISPSPILWEPIKDSTPPRAAVGNLEMNSQRGNEIHCAAGKGGTWVGFFNSDEKKYFVLGWLDKPNKPTKKGSLSFVLCESPFTSVSIVNRGHPPLSCLSENTPELSERKKFVAGVNDTQANRFLTLSTKKRKKNN